MLIMYVEILLIWLYYEVLNYFVSADNDLNTRRKQITRVQNKTISIIKPMNGNGIRKNTPPVYKHLWNPWVVWKSRDSDISSGP